MKFNRRFSEEFCERLEKQYKEYIRKTPMTRKEQRALREWVKAGNSVYENPSGAWADGQVPVEFLTVYRDEEYIRQNTKGMTSEEARRFALNYYGWSDEENSPNEPSAVNMEFSLENISAEELPFS